MPNTTSGSKSKGRSTQKTAIPRNITILRRNSSRIPSPDQKYRHKCLSSIGRSAMCSAMLRGSPELIQNGNFMLLDTKALIILIQLITPKFQNLLPLTNLKIVDYMNECYHIISASFQQLPRQDQLHYFQHPKKMVEVLSYVVGSMDMLESIKDLNIEL